jgi:hypothetical protein
MLAKTIPLTMFHAAGSSRARVLLSTVTLLALMLVVTGCVRRKDRSGVLKGIRTVELHLTNRHTLAPDLVIRVPEGFVESWFEEAQYDKFYILDPSDSGETTRGTIQLDITPVPYWSIRDTAKFERTRGSIGEHDVDWRETKLTSPGDTTRTIYQREMVQREIFNQLRSPDGTGELTLHALIVGSDPKLVEQLTAAVESIRVLPLKPNV